MFFITFFNLVTEWLGVALDSPLTIIAILFYLFIIIRYSKKFSPSHLIRKIGDVGEEFYAQFVKMFHYKETLHLGVMGILALHLLTDIGHFIIPYIVGAKGLFYFGHLGEGHSPLFQLLRDDILHLSGIQIIASILIYLLNIAAMIFLLVLPAFIWYRFFKEKPLRVSRTSLALVFSSLLCFVLMPVFFIQKISVERVAGVDILTKGILKSSSLIDFVLKDRPTAIIIVACLSLSLGIILWFLEFNKKIEEDIFIIAILIGLAFFGFYIFYYFLSLYHYYIASMIILFKSSEFLIAAYFILFALITIVFYIGGYLFFIYEVFKRHFFESIDKYLK